MLDPYASALGSKGRGKFDHYIKYVTLLFIYSSC